MRTSIEIIYADIGKRVKALREARKITQERLGASLTPPVTRAAIANVEAGKQRVLVHTLVQLAASLSAGIDEIVPSAVFPADRGDHDITGELVSSGAMSLKDAQALAARVPAMTGRKAT